MSGSDRGMILAVTMMMALVASIVSYGVLQLAVSQGRQGRFFRSQTTARYLAEAGMVLAYERLRAAPGWCGGTEQLDANGNGTLEDWERVTIAVTNCGGPAGTTHEIRVTVDN
ncbi:MAG: hypothetical protein Q8R78_06150 [Candidatus Omnitrophota bacterium]|nr:hypothetical protein [Candidatus Omnitrophota bacterium]